MGHERARRNVFSVGDSCHERSAIIYACQALADPRVCCKSLKFLERPNIHGLVLQHQKVCEQLTTLIKHRGNLDLFVALTKDAIPVDVNDLAIQSVQALQELPVACGVA